MTSSITELIQRVEELTATEIQALEFLVSQGSDQIGEIDTDEKLAAALVFSRLVQKGFAIVSKEGDDHPVFHPTAKARAFHAHKERG